MPENRDTEPAPIPAGEPGISEFTFELGLEGTPNTQILRVPTMPAPRGFVGVRADTLLRTIEAARTRANVNPSAAAVIYFASHLVEQRPKQEELYHAADGRIVVNVASQEILLDGKLTHFLAKEFKVLSFLALNIDHVCTLQAMIEHIWHGYESAGPTLRTHLSRIRKKLGPELGRALVARREIGYMLRSSIPPE